MGEFLEKAQFITRTVSTQRGVETLEKARKALVALVDNTTPYEAAAVGATLAAVELVRVVLVALVEDGERRVREWDAEEGAKGKG